MKKLMSMLGVVTLTAIGASSVVACGTPHASPVDPNQDIIDKTVTQVSQDIRTDLWSYKMNSSIDGYLDSNMNDANLSIKAADLEKIQSDLSKARDGDTITNNTLVSSIYKYEETNILSNIRTKIYGQNNYKSVLFNNIDKNNILTLNTTASKVKYVAFDWLPSSGKTMFNLVDYKDKVSEAVDKGGYNVKFWYKFNVSLHMDLHIFDANEVQARPVTVQWSGYFSNSDSAVGKIMQDSYNVVGNLLANHQQFVNMDMMTANPNGKYYSINANQGPVSDYTLKYVKDELAKGSFASLGISLKENGDDVFNYFDPNSINEVTNAMYKTAAGDYNYDFRTIYNTYLGDNKDEGQWPNDKAKQKDFAKAISDKLSTYNDTFKTNLDSFITAAGTGGTPDHGLSTDNVFSYGTYKLTNWSVQGLVYQPLDFSFYGSRASSTRTDELTKVANKMADLWGPGGALSWSNNYFLKDAKNGSYDFHIKLNSDDMTALGNDPESTYFNAAKDFNTEISAAINDPTMFSRFAGLLFDDLTIPGNDLGFKLSSNKATDPVTKGVAYESSGFEKNKLYYDLDGFRFNFEKDSKDHAGYLWVRQGVSLN